MYDVNKLMYIFLHLFLLYFFQSINKLFVSQLIISLEIIVNGKDVEELNACECLG